MGNPIDENRYRHICFVTGGEKIVLPSVVPPEKVLPPRSVEESDDSVTPEERRFLRRILERAGVSLTHYRLAPLRRRIPACLRGLRVKTIAEAERALTEKPDRLPGAISSLLIGVTEFFRDTPVFDALREAVIPNLLQETHRPRIWSVACSDGAELYSVAILLAEHGALERSHLLGSDCRTEAVERAQRGRYDAAALRGTPTHLRERYFKSDGRWIQVIDRVRRPVQWQVADAVADGPAETWDLILCRNMAIYLQPPAAMRMWQMLTTALRPGGTLVVGKAERPHRGELERVGPCMYTKRSQRCTRKPISVS